MKIEVKKRHLPFEIAYVVTLFILLLNQIDALSNGELLRKVKYPYVFFVGILVITNPTVKKGMKASLFAFLLYFVHNYLFGHVFVNEMVATQIESNTSQEFWFLLFVLVTFLYVAQNNFFKEFITLSFFTTGAQLLVAVLQHRDNIVNPVWGLYQTFTAEYRFKNSFGFIHPGYTANAAFLVIVLSIFFFELYRYTEDFKKPWFWISFVCIDALGFEVLMAAAERSGIISTFMVVATYLFFCFFRLRFEGKTLFVIILVVAAALVVFIVNGGFTSIWEDSNREMNISVNYPLFQVYGDPWTGLGFIENAGFHEDQNLFPMPTSSLDMYYVYIYFSTGLLGSILIGLSLITILIKLIINKKTNMNILGLAFYITMLFFAFWQSNLFTHRYISSYVISTVILCTMCKDCCLGDGQGN